MEKYPSQDLNIFVKDPKQPMIFLGNYLVGFLQRFSIEMDAGMMFPRIDLTLPCLNFHLENWPLWCEDGDSVTIRVRDAIQDNRDVDILVSGKLTVLVGKNILGGLTYVKYVGELIGGGIAKKAESKLSIAGHESIKVPDWVEYKRIGGLELTA
jgi:hypothetical protein